MGDDKVYLSISNGKSTFMNMADLNKAYFQMVEKEIRFRETTSGMLFPVTYDKNNGDEDELDDNAYEAYEEARRSVEKYLHDADDIDGSFDHIYGNEDALSSLTGLIRAPVEHAELYKAYGMSLPKGVLLYGPPGCGKTMFARAAAAEMHEIYGEKLTVEFMLISGAELQSPYVGMTERKIKEIFTFARAYKAFKKHPLLIFIDEADAILPDRNTSRNSWEKTQVATFLAEMDGVIESGAFVMLATNRPDAIDQAVLRDGRCDMKICIKRPNMDAVEHIVRKNFEGVPLHGGSIDDMVFAAVESFFDPHKIIMEGHAFVANPQDKTVANVLNKHFTLENIVSGAMAASVPSRAKIRAFQRDKLSGTLTGVTTDDVIGAVKDIFDENKGLSHSFAEMEFRQEFSAELSKKMGGK
jgi:proteasome-associated ATPase